MDIAHINQKDHRYPSSLKNYLNKHVPNCITAIGNIDILKRKKLAFFCSVKCPGDLITQALDLAQALRKSGITVIGGFHSPVEREILKTLLRSPHPVIICPARSIDGMRFPKEYKKPLSENRLLFLSPFNEKYRRITVETSNIRNKFVSAIAEKVFVAYASPGSKTMQFCIDVLSKGKPLVTLKSDNNKLLNLGAKPVNPADIENLL
ncbi:MAG: DNA-processing protein DprA [Nitrospinota bacterium]